MLQFINSLRLKNNENPNKKIRLEPLLEIPAGSRLCQACEAALRRAQNDESINHRIGELHLDDSPDLSFWRTGGNSHTGCVFGCGEKQQLMNISHKCRVDFLMNYKFYCSKKTLMCTEHFGLDNYWSLVKKVNNPLPVNQFKQVSEEMFIFHQDFATGKSRQIFDFDNLDSITDYDFEQWIY